MVTDSMTDLPKGVSREQQAWL